MGVGGMTLGSIWLPKCMVKVNYIIYITNCTNKLLFYLFAAYTTVSITDDQDLFANMNWIILSEQSIAGSMLISYHLGD